MKYPPGVFSRKRTPCFLETTFAPLPVTFHALPSRPLYLLPTASGASIEVLSVLPPPPRLGALPPSLPPFKCQRSGQALSSPPPPPPSPRRGTSAFLPLNTYFQALAYLHSLKKQKFMTTAIGLYLPNLTVPIHLLWNESASRDEITAFAFVLLASSGLPRPSREERRASLSRLSSPYFPSAS